jgi:hypothetical protein
MKWGAIVSGMTHTIAWYWQWFKMLFGISDWFQRGRISLANGVHEIQIQTDPANGQPTKVYTWVSEPYPGVCVCLGDVNLAGTTIVPYGFVLYADIKSNAAVVDWLVEYYTGPDPIDDPVINISA